MAIPLTQIEPDVEPFPINEMPNVDLAVNVGMDVFILGYPFGRGVAGLPVWKRGSIASEPELVLGAQLHVFVDTASRPGMSGSPVIRRNWGNYTTTDGSVVMTTGSATKFVGVYSGRIIGTDPLDAQLGLTWPAAFVPEIITGNRMDV